MMLYYNSTRETNNNSTTTATNDNNVQPCDNANNIQQRDNDNNVQQLDDNTSSDEEHVEYTQFEIENVVAHKRGRFLVSWRGYSEEHNRWLKKSELSK